MLDKQTKAKIKKYNEYHSKAESLRFEIEVILSNQYMIETHNKAFKCDGEASVFECCSDFFDIEMIENIIQTAKELEEEVGEYPETCEIVERMKERGMI